MAANDLSVQGERVRRPPIKYTRNATRQRYSTTMPLWASSSHGPTLALVALTRPAVYVSLTGDRAHYRNAGEEQLVLGEVWWIHPW
jgi:hypothetical protein